MIRYTVYRETKEIELLSGGTVEELKDIVKLFKGFTFKLGTNSLQKSGISVGATFVPIIKTLDYN